MQLSAVGTSGAEVLIEQQYLIPLQAGESEEHAIWNRTLFEGMVKIIAEHDEEMTKNLLLKFLGDSYDAAPEDIKASATRSELIIGMNSFINNQWARDFCAFETADYLKKLKIPLFAATGDKDVQVPPVSNLAGFKAFSRENWQITSMPGLNHLMQKCETCAMMEYGDLEETFSVELLEMMVTWINKQ